ncbi:MAG TPA: beta-ketoacyl synthase N-terminal-like domain-containing protein [Bdellovibrionales bacterium]|nr:beta-ketoacyl synthase N-terminal-like domain-containing protein [Bdellovibrionales bacterium]
MDSTGAQNLKILAYGCTSSAGQSVEDFWRGLCTGRDHSRRHTPATRVCQWPARGSSVLDDLSKELLTAWKETRARLGESALNRAVLDVGVIFASTKGCIDDYVWADAPVENRDSLRPVLDQFLKEANLLPKESICVSNACASALSALYLARSWIRQERVSHVLILAADAAGPFVARGFEVLKTLTPELTRPFDRRRQGFYLGEAACSLLVGPESDPAPGIRVEGVALDAEGFAVTRPSAGGESLRRACLSLGAVRPDLILAHGTATIANDETEDRVFSLLYDAPITSTKWSIGHTLGASGAMDLIAACEILRNRKVFQLANTEQIDPAFSSKYLIGPGARDFAGRRVLVSSLGFGGIHGVAMLGAPS